MRVKAKVNPFVGERLKELLNENNISMSSVADEYGLSRQTIQLYCSSKVEVPTKMIINFAKKFGVTSDYLLGLSDFKNASEASLRISEDIDELTYRMRDLYSTLAKVNAKAKGETL